MKKTISGLLAFFLALSCTKDACHSLEGDYYSACASCEQVGWGNWGEVVAIELADSSLHKDPLVRFYYEDPDFGLVKLKLRNYCSARDTTLVYAPLYYGDERNLRRGDLMHLYRNDFLLWGYKDGKAYKRSEDFYVRGW